MSRDCLDSFQESVAAFLAALPAIIPGINSEIKQTRQRPIKLISSHFKLSISNGCFMEF